MGRTILVSNRLPVTVSHVGGVLRVERSEPADFGVQRDPRFDITRRGRTVVSADLKSPQGRDLVLRLVSQADGLIEGFRPGVMERLGLAADHQHGVLVV